MGRMPQRIKVFDFFCGCGGTSAGFRAAGMDVVLGIDCDEAAEEAFKLNFRGTSFLRKDIRDIGLEDLQEYVDTCAGAPILFCGCAPCQPFSKQNRSRSRSDIRRTLLDEFACFIVRYLPQFVFCENVPGLQVPNDASKGPFGRFLKTLRGLGYSVDWDIIDSQDYGVPQKRRRLVLIASTLGEVKMPSATHGPNSRKAFSTVWEWIGHLPRVAAGCAHPLDPIHRATSLSATNMCRIRNTPAGGSRLDWPDDLVLRCHREDVNARTHTDVYGRLRKDQTASALTTKCISLSNGRFGHPEQDRAITIREAALLQTFPRRFRFPRKRAMRTLARLIGNAVPVRLATTYGRVFTALARSSP